MSEEEESNSENDSYEYDSDPDDDDCAASMDGSLANAKNKNNDEEEDDDDCLDGPLPAPPPPMSNVMLRTKSGQEVPASLMRQVSYTVSDNEKMLQHRSKLMDAMMDYGLDTADALNLLRSAKWDKKNVTGSDISSALSGPFESSMHLSVPSSPPPECPCCCEDEFPPGMELRDLGCGHFLCGGCWKSYLETACRNDGAKIVLLQCFMSTGGRNGRCNKVVPVSFFEEFCDESTLALYRSKLVDDYVQLNDTACYCPNLKAWGQGVACSRVVSYKSPRQRDVQCFCGNFFCFQCGLPAHQPLGCTTIRQWLEKEVDESETTAYLSAHSKPCPSCGSPIGVHICSARCAKPCREQGRPELGGCNHFTCRCGHEFCWMCLAPWSTHGSNTGGYYQCNLYTSDASDDVVPGGGSAKIGAIKQAEADRVSKAAEQKRYTHHYARYQQHWNGVRNNEALRKMVSTKVTELAVAIDATNAGTNGERYTRFLAEAAALIGPTRRLLMWSYVLAFYLPQSQSNWMVLHSQQQILDDMVNKLHKQLVDWCDKEQPKAIDALMGTIESASLRDTSILRNWPFKEQVTQRVQVLSKYTRSIKEQIVEWESEVEKGESTTQGKSASAIDLESSAAASSAFGGWVCQACTFVNGHLAHQERCEICRTPRIALP